MTEHNIRKSILNELFEKISEVTKVEDIGYHRVIDGKLVPYYKTQTDVLGINHWIKVHGENPVSVKGTCILEELFSTMSPVEIYNTKTDKRAADAFFLFGVDSIMIIPVISNEEIKGIVCTVAIDYLHQFTKEEISQCHSFVKQYLNDNYNKGE